MTLHICVTMCTRERPEMLSACLNSVLPQLAASTVQTTLIMVENSDNPACRDLMACFRDAFPSVRIEYLMEPELGIPFARNAGVERALKLHADWIVFIDDDEEACEGWFENLTAAASRWDADVFHGPVRLIYPADCPEWIRMKQFDGGANGTIVASAATNNTMARSRLFSASGLGLRFDTSLRFSGGSDVELFSRATRSGAMIRWIDDAVVREHVPTTRQSSRWLLLRMQRNAANTVTIIRKQHGYTSALALGLSKAGRLAIEAFTASLLLPLIAFGGEKASRQTFKIRTKLAKLRGYFLSLLGFSPKPYRNVDGR